MKKMLLLATSACLFAMNAQASDMMKEMRPYVGIDYAYSDADISKIDNKQYFNHQFNSGDINVGVRMGKYMGVEAFFQKSMEEKKTVFNTIKTKADFYAYGLDLMGYMPVHEKIELIGALGVAQYDVTAKARNTETGAKIHHDDSGFGIRMGAGVQYNITDNVAVRALGRYTWLDVDNVNHLKEFVIGARYSF